MAQIIGDLSVRVGDKDYTLHLGMRALADLQDDFGQDLAPLTAMQSEGTLPSFRVLVRTVEVALRRYHADAPSHVADDILASHPDVFARLLEAAFPAPEGGARPQGKRKAGAST